MPVSLAQARKLLERSVELHSHALICIIGPFLSGKTTLVKNWLKETYGQIEPYYLSVNEYLLERLQSEGPLDELARVKARARLVMQVYLEDAIRKALTDQPLLVLDAIEILLPYELDLVTLTARYARRDQIGIICAPEDPEHGFQFHFAWDRCHSIRLASQNDSASRIRSNP